MSIDKTYSARRTTGSRSRAVRTRAAVVGRGHCNPSHRTDPAARPRSGNSVPGQTGPLNAITDVAGIAVGHVTLIEGEGKLVPGKGPIRTGVTAILPRPRGNWDPVFAATFNQNGNGDMTGINWIKESGFSRGRYC